MISIGSTIDDASNTTTAQNLTIVTEQTARFRPNPHCSHVNKRIVDAPFEQVAPSRVLMLSQRKRQRTENAQKAAITASAEKDANSSGGAAGQESAAEDVVSEPPLVVSDSSEISEPAIMHEHQSEMMILKEELTSSSPRMTSQQVETSLKGARDFFDKIFTVLKGDLANTEFTSNSSTTANRYDTYGGLAGTALFFYRIHQSSSNNYVDAIQLAKRCIEEACQLVDLLDLSMHSMETGLMKSPCGVWAIASLVYDALGETESSRVYLVKFIKMQKVTTNILAHPELYYGTAGYLHSLLYLKSALSNESVSSIITPESIRSVFSHILDQGRLGKERLFSGAPDRQSHGSQPKAKSGTSFLWCWFKERYVGVAHGIAGILIQVIQAVQYFEKASKHTMTPLRILLGPHLDLDEIKREIRVCIEFLICELRLANGNYAIRVDETLWNSPQMYPADERVQLSHGAAGVGVLLCKAYELLEEDRYLNHAKDAAEVVWERGISMESDGICHGTSGNAYLFLHLYKLTKDDIYLQRAILFMQAVIENGVGVSGSRCSLFQGLAGVGCLVNDIVNIETFKGIPGISI